MRFQLAHKLVTYLLVLATLGAVSATHALSIRSGALFLAAVALSLPVDPGSRAAAALDRAGRAVRLAALAVFAFLLWRIWRGLSDPDYGPGFDLGLALLAYKLFQRRLHRDYVHVLAFSFVLVLVSATLAASFLFVVVFAIYVGLAVWTLILFHLRREMEENYLVKHSAQAPSQKVGVQRILGSRRVVGSSFFAATALVAAAVLVGGLAIFMIVPRFGAGFVLGNGTLAPGTLASSEEMTIGRYGTGQAARHRIVMRATVPSLASLANDEARRRAADGLYFRGAVYDAYEHGRWWRGRTPELGTLVVEDAAGGARRFSVREPSEGARDERSLGRAARQEIEGAIQQEIETVGMPVSVLFGIDRAVAFELPATRLGAAGALRVVPNWSGEAALRVGAGPGGAAPVLADAHYVAYSFPRGTAASAATAAGDAGDVPTLAPMARSATLALPPTLASDLGLVAETIVTRADRRATEAAARVAVVVDWLRARHGYTPEPPPAPAGADPVDAFVHGTGRGHCELFASATVLLLRASGIPARYVTGFRGGEWNALGGYIGVRDDRAHAWAEAFLPDAGWVRVDATPPGATPRPPGRLGELVDALEYNWSRWMIGYDLPRQRDLAHRAGRRLAPLGWVAGRRPDGGAGSLTLFVAVALVLAAVGIRLARLVSRRRVRAGERGGFSSDRRRRRASAGDGAIGRLYSRTVARLGRAGWTRRPNETPHEYARRLRAAGVYPAGELDLLTDCYTAARFGTEAADEARVAELGAKLARSGSTAGHPGTSR